MRHFVVVAVIFTFMSISCLLINSVHAQEWSFTEKELWKLEEIYMQNYKNKNVKELSNFWHENFIGCQNGPSSLSI